MIKGLVVEMFFRICFYSVTRATATKELFYYRVIYRDIVDTVDIEIKFLF